MLFNKRYIKSIERGEDEIFFEEVLKANNKISISNSLISLSTDELLQRLEYDQTTFQIDAKDERVYYIDRILKILDKSIRFKEISTKQ